MVAYKTYVDWNAGGNFTDAADDVTSRTLDGRAAVTMRYGRDQERSLSPIAPGEGSLILDNLDRALSPENTSSPLNGQVVPGRQVQVTAVDATLGTVVLLRAQFDDFTVVPGVGNKHVAITLIDALGALRGQKVSTGLYQGLRTGEALHVLLDAVGWPSTARDIDPGATVMPNWWVDSDDVYDAIMDLVASEGPPALVTVDTTNRIAFRSRHHRLQNAASVTSQATWRSGAPEPSISDPTDYNHGWKEIINSVVFQVPLRSSTGARTVVWSSPGLISVASGETVTIAAQASDPFVNAVTPVRTTALTNEGNPNGDYTVITGTVSLTLSRTSGLSTVISITATAGGPAVLSDLQLRAVSVTVANTVQVQIEAGSSVTRYGRRSLPDGQTPTWAGLNDAQAIANIILSARSERLPTISVGMVAGNRLRLTEQLTRDLSDRVHVVEAHTGLNADCYIEQISHSITQGGTEHRTVFGLEKAPAQVTGALILGSATNGVIGTGKLGKRAFADPITMFVLGSATNGVIGTNILAA